jgi:mRNA-degrading endonuclease RelE of RelBE toxin-antitoxin system
VTDRKQPQARVIDPRRDESARTTYDVNLEAGAVDDLAELPRRLHAAIIARAEALAIDPRPPGATPLKGELKGSYRMNVRHVYRIGYEVDGAARTVAVWQIGHRDKFYEKAKRRRK